MTEPELLDSRLLSRLRCPRDHSDLTAKDRYLHCARGHRYPVVMGIPVFLLAEKQQTIGIASASLEAAESMRGEPLYLDTLGISETEKQGIQKNWTADGKIDAVVSHLIGATSGWGYAHLIGALSDYPIPKVPLPDGDGKFLLDVGSSWGRWSMSAARKGWDVISLDPSLGALLAAKRVSSSLGLKLNLVCGDARYLPFKANNFHGVFS